MTDDKNNTFGEFGARSTKFDELLKKYQTIDEDSEVFPAPENEDESVTSTPEKQEFQISMPENSETKTPKSRIKKKRSANNKSVKLTDKKDTSEKAKTKKKKVAQPKIEQPKIEQPEIEQTEIDKFDFDMSEQEVEQFDFAMDEYEIEKFDLEMNELEEIVTAQSEPEEPETEVYEPQQVDFVEEEPVQFNFSLPELEEYESELPESERFDFSKDFDLLVSEQPEEVQSEPEQFDFGASELEQINEIQPEEFDFAIEETEQFDLESEQFDEIQPEIEQLDEIQPEIEQLDEAQTEPEQLEYVQPEQFEETQYEAEQLDYTQPEYETGFSFDDQSVQMQSSDEGPDEPDYSYDLDMFGTRQTKSSIDIDSFDDSWLDTALDRTLFYNAVRPSQYDMPEPATYVPVDVEKDPFEPNVKPITQENGFVEQFPEEADKNAMAGGYIAPSDFSDFNFDPDSGMDFDYEEKNAYMQNFSAAENTDGLIYNEESEKKKSEKTKQPASRIFQRIIKPPKERDQKKTD